MSNHLMPPFTVINMYTEDYQTFCNQKAYITRHKLLVYWREKLHHYNHNKIIKH